ncbi:MAG TPA: cutinase family protein [Pseudonocardiaceae bacterium]|nr:cutinase family protein [Pseudonocardiaceae bacterium]
MTRLRRAIALAGATCALLAATATVAQAAPGTGQADTCPDIAFLGARGSGEAPGLGTTVQDTADRYKNAVGPAVTVETRPVSYPAVAVFDLEVLKRLQRAVADAGRWRWRTGLADQRPLPGLNQARSTEWLLSSRTKYDHSVVAGTKNIRAQMSSLGSRCPATRFVLAGYSQGAQVVTRFLEGIDAANPADRALAERIIGIALFGSPMFAQYDPPVQVNRSRQGPAPYSFLRQGVYQTLNDLPIGEPSVLSHRPWVTKTHSYCLQRDVVCQSSSPLYRLFQFLGVDEGPSAIEPHLRYRDHYTQDAATWLAGLTGPVLRRDGPRVAVPR